MEQGPVQNNIRAAREALGLAQQTLAQRIGISRQALGAIEAQRQIPSTLIAMRLARALETSVEALFELTEPEQLEVKLPEGKPSSPRVRLGCVQGQWVAHPLLAQDLTRAADGVLTSPPGPDGLALVSPFERLDALAHTTLIAGCSPLLGALCERLLRSRKAPSAAAWIMANSEQAMTLLTQGLVHIAGVHLATDQAQAAALVRARWPTQDMVIVHLNTWRQGLILPARNPLGLRSAADLLRPHLRIAWREPGAASTTLLMQELGRVADKPQLEATLSHTGPRLRDHMAVAQAVAMSVADVGVGIEAAALAHELTFIPLRQERFDLIMSAQAAKTPQVTALLDALQARGLRQDIEALGGYDAADMGELLSIGAGAAR